ncbi:MAG: hypothetical protein QXT19_01110 [Candidatus Woesearchaeota archaeon]
MNITVALGILAGLIIAYHASKWLARKNLVMLEYRRMMHDLLTNEKYQVKGKFD